MTPHGRGGSHLLVPSLDPPSPVQPPTVFQPISSTWGMKQGVNGVRERSGVTLAPLSPIRAILGSHNVPWLRDSSRSDPQQCWSLDGVKHPHRMKFLRNPHPCTATTAPSQALFLHPFPTQISPSSNPTPQIHTALPKRFSHPIFPLESPHSKTQPFKPILHFLPPFPYRNLTSPSNPSKTPFPVGISASQTLSPLESPHPGPFPHPFPTLFPSGPSPCRRLPPQIHPKPYSQ